MECTVERVIGGGGQTFCGIQPIFMVESLSTEYFTHECEAIIDHLLPAVHAATKMYRFDPWKLPAIRYVTIVRGFRN